MRNTQKKKRGDSGLGRNKMVIKKNRHGKERKGKNLAE